MKSKKDVYSNKKQEWSSQKVTDFQQDFLEWYEAEKRLLPWRESDDGYRVWVSEIMLQQTRVDTVIPYFYRFMEWFPTIQDLASAPEEKLLKAWEGLGYYSRVRNMQVAAQQIVEDYQGEMPQDIQEISKLKGIGPYTAGAIASIAFHQPEPAIDGNVMRVFSRLFCISEDIAKPASRKVFDKVVRQVISHDDPSSFNQGIMDLGSSICTPTSPSCESCPIASYCEAYEKGNMLQFPVKSKKIKVKPVYYVGQAIQNEKGEYLIEQRESEGLLANLWHFPLIEVSEADYRQLQQNWQKFEEEKEPQLILDLVSEDEISLEEWLKEKEEKSTVVWQKQPIGELTHIFSHLKWHILVTYGREKAVKQHLLTPRQKWVSPADFDSYPFPKPQIKMVAILKQKNYL